MHKCRRENIFRISSFLLQMAYKKNILAHCKKIFDTKERFDLFMASWNLMVMVDSEKESSRLWGRLKEDFRDFPKVLEYVKTTWIDKYKERFDTCWTDIVMHFGTTTTNRYDLVTLLSNIMSFVFSICCYCHSF